MNKCPLTIKVSPHNAQWKLFLRMKTVPSNKKNLTLQIKKLFPRNKKRVPNNEQLFTYN